MTQTIEDAFVGHRRKTLEGRCIMAIADAPGLDVPVRVEDSGSNVDGRDDMVVKLRSEGWDVYVEDDHIKIGYGDRP